MLRDTTSEYRHARAPGLAPIRRPWGLNDRTERLLLALAMGVGLLLLVTGSVFAYGRVQSPGFYRGVSIAGVDLAGMTPAEAQARLDARVKSSAPATVTLAVGARHWSVSSASLGARYDTADSLRDAYALGRSGNPLIDSRVWLQGLFGGYRSPLIVDVDAQATYRVLEQVAAAVAVAPVNARYALGNSDALTIVPGKSGTAIDVARTELALTQRLADLSAQPVNVELVTVPPAVTASRLQPGLAQASRLTSAPLVLTAGDGTWELGRSTLRSLVTVDSRNDAVGLDPARLRTSIGALAAQVDTPAKNPTIAWQANAFAVVPGTPGQALDVDASANAVDAALRSGRHRVALVTTAVPPAITEADAQAVASRAGALAARPLAVTWAGGSTTLAPADLAGTVRFSEQPGQSPPIAVSVDDGAVGKVIESLAKRVDTPAQDAQLRYVNGAVTVASPERPGVALDTAQSAAAIRAALLGGQDTVALKTTPVEPRVTAAMASSIVIRDELATSDTPYAGSIANRKWNVELAVKTVNGTLIPPGGTFSFTGTTGPIDTAHGYKLGYGIVATSGPNGVATVPSVGGGICQVSTTLFQAAFWAGMPIVERHYHYYWIASYGQPPAGMKGLDATVDTDAGLDFKFKNPTSDWLAIVATANGSTVHFELWGTKQNWQVKVDGPVITNVVKADQTMQYQPSSQLAPGTTLYLEEAGDGFDASIHRQVIDNGKVIDDLTLTSHYVPSANITLVGPKP